MDRSFFCVLWLAAFLAPAIASAHVVAIRYVALRENPSTPVRPGRAEVLKLVDEMSKLWSPCGVKFVLEEYLTPSAARLNLPLNPTGSEDRHRIRQAFSSPRHALFVVTKKWNRKADPHDDGSNAFSSVPDGSAQGVIFEDWVATSSVLLSHEFGHLGGDLDDTHEELNLMNHVVDEKTVELTPSQCERVRETLATHRRGWLR